MLKKIVIICVSISIFFKKKLVEKRLWIYDALGRLIDTQKIHSTEMQLSTYSGVVILKVQGVASSVVSIGE